MGLGQKIFTGLMVGFAALVVIALVGAGVFYWLWTSEPSHWTAFQAWKQATTAPQRKQQAVHLEQRISQTLQRLLLAQEQRERLPQATPGATAGNPAAPGAGAALENRVLQAEEEIIITTQEANAWLTERLPAYLENQKTALPKEVTDVMISIEGRSLLLAFRFANAKVNQVFTIETRPEINSDNGVVKARFNYQGMRGGRLGLPQNMVDSAAEEGKGADKAMQSLLATLKSENIEPVLPYPGDKRRQLRFTSLALRDDTLALRVQVENVAKH